MRLSIACLFTVVAAGCSSDATNADSGPPPEAIPVCGPMLPASAMPSPAVAGQGTPASSPALASSGVCTEVTTELTRAEADDIVGQLSPADYVAIGGALEFDGPAALAGGPFPHGIDFVVPADIALGPANAPSHRIVVVEKRADGRVLIVPASNMVYESHYRRLHFHAPELGTYQAALPRNAGKTVHRHFTWRGIGGVSMGGFGATVNFWTHPDRYDVVAVMGADPGADFTYTLGLVGEWFFGGFCDATSGKLGQLCPPARKPLVEQHEEFMDFEHLNYQRGEGVGLTLRRNTFMRAYRDLSRALGNAAYAPNSMDAKAPGASYLPPGITSDVLGMAPAEFCDPARIRRTALHDFFDRKYNPDGKLPVITFCDGGDGDKKGLAVFDPDLPQRNPMHLLLAVDVNDNGIRDSGEPVITQATEPWDDCGTDGKCDKDEPGWDAVKNPDPGRDNFHWYFNPNGPEGNWRLDPGEHTDDFGLDGVKGSCQLGQTPPQGVAGCYDWGEGNGKFDVGPNVARWYAHDVHSLLTGYLDVKAVSEEALDRLDVYYDAGIHDFFNAHVATNNIVAALGTRGMRARVWEGFPLLAGLRPSQEDKFRIEQVDFKSLGRHVYVRYGDPDATPEQVENTGDGRHVGTVLQVIHRGQMMFYFFSRAWPQGDVDTDVNPGKTIDSMFTTSSGRVTPYTVFTPPGYYDERNATKGYPVVYLGHGYGMKPEDLAQIAVIAQNAMIDDRVPPAERMQKMIIVFVDAVCRPGGDLNSASETVPLTGDLCEEGGFYTDHPEGSYKGEQMLIELQARIEKEYRTKAPADIDVIQ